MLRNKKVIKSYIVWIFILGITSLSISSSVFAVNYEIGLTKGTDILIVEQYDDTAWKNTVNASFSPNNWFEGDADIVGAQSKITLKGWNSVIWEMYDIFVSIFLQSLFESEEIIPLLMLMATQGYNETTINNNYTNSYNLWIGLTAVWNFTVGDFEEDPSNANDILIVFQDPTNIDYILNDYNNLSAELNSNPAFSGYNFPILESDEFLWLFIFNGLTLGTPSGSYLENLINTLNCDNATVSNNILTINRTGKTHYTIEIAFGSKGTISSFIVKDISDNTIFQIVRRNSEWIFYTIIIILVSCIGGLSAYLIFRKRKINRIRNKNK